VENVVDLAKYLLSDQKEFTSEEIDKIIDKGTTSRIYMDQKVKVHIFYWTAWRENGKTRFTYDIYNYDEATYKALKKAS
jgi:murein L,D-transpeptidase YcbB/YkuD